MTQGNEIHHVVLLGVSGGIAAYKAVDLARRLTRNGYEVHTVMTPAACAFVTPLSFAAVTGNPARSEMFPDDRALRGESLYPHLYPADRAAVFVVAPATADIIARLACGMASDLVDAAALSVAPSCRRIVCPAMNARMWQQPVVQENVKRLEQRGWKCIGPDEGDLACGDTGPGRMAEPAVIAEAVAAEVV